MLFLEVEAENLNECFQVILKPQKVEEKGGRGVGFGELRYILAQNSVPIPVLGKLLNGLPRIYRVGKGVDFLF